MAKTASKRFFYHVPGTVVETGERLILQILLYIPRTYDGSLDSAVRRTRSWISELDISFCRQKNVPGIHYSSK